MNHSLKEKLASFFRADPFYFTVKGWSRAAYIEKALDVRKTIIKDILYVRHTPRINHQTAPLEIILSDLEKTLPIHSVYIYIDSQRYSAFDQIIDMNMIDKIPYSGTRALDATILGFYSLSDLLNLTDIKPLTIKKKITV